MTRRLGMALLVAFALAGCGSTRVSSAFSDHVVLVWTTNGHSYAIGFHDIGGLRPTLALDLVLARGIRLVPPP